MPTSIPSSKPLKPIKFYVTGPRNESEKRKQMKGDDDERRIANTKIKSEKGSERWAEWKRVIGKQSAPMS